MKIRYLRDLSEEADLQLADGCHTDSEDEDLITDQLDDSEKSYEVCGSVKYICNQYNYDNNWDRWNKLA